MRALFPDIPEAADNTVKIAEMCNMDFEFGHYHLPEFKLPEGVDSFDYLKEKCTAGLAVRYGDNCPEVRKQLEYELDMINKMGFTDYFLIVQDFVNYAKSQGIPVGPGLSLIHISRVRAFGTIHEFEGKLYIQTGRSKPVSQQMAKNPKVEILSLIHI